MGTVELEPFGDEHGRVVYWDPLNGCESHELDKSCQGLGPDSGGKTIHFGIDDCPAPAEIGKCDHWSHVEADGNGNEHYYFVPNTSTLVFYTQRNADCNTSVHYSLWDVDSAIDNATFVIPAAWHCGEEPTAVVVLGTGFLLTLSLLVCPRCPLQIKIHNLFS